jgi:osmotically-inducible protein OsmY
MKYMVNIAFLSVLLATAGCVMNQKSAGEKVDDAWIHTKVKSALVGEGSSNINVEVYQGKVQLAGFVGSDQGRDTAEKKAAAIKGVRDVSNQLVVQTEVRSPGRRLDDGVVAGRVKTALASHAETNAIDVNVEVRHGVVLLSGFVNTRAERDAAARIASTALGVVKVINGIDTIYPS